VLCLVVMALVHLLKVVGQVRGDVHDIANPVTEKINNYLYIY
jgi:hypothetical protein